MRIFLGLGIVIVLIIGYVGFMWLSYISDSVTEGSAYGYTIGSEKDETLRVVKALYSGKDVSLGFNYYDEEDPINQPIDFERDLSKFYDDDMWKFYFGHRNSIRLYFQDESLVKIYRHRQYFELP